MFGFIDRKGTTVVEPAFDAAESFENGVARVSRKKLWGVLSKDGALVVPTELSQIGDVSEGYMTAAFGGVRDADGDLKGARWGIVSTGGEWLLKPTLYSAGAVHDGLAAIARDQGECNYFSVHRTVLVKAGLLFAGDFSEGLAAHSPYSDADEYRTGYLDPTGATIVPARFALGAMFTEGFAPVLPERDGGWTLIDQEGRERTAERYERIVGFREGFCAVRRDGRWTYLDKALRPVGDFRFDQAKAVVNGFARVSAGGRWNLLLPDGRLADEAGFDELFWPRKHRLRFSRDGKQGYLDEEGRVAIPAVYQDAQDFADGWAGVNVGGRWGFIDESGAVVVKPAFEKVRPRGDGLAAVQTGGKWGYIDGNGAFAIAPAFGDAYSFSEGRAIVSPE